MSAYTKRLAWKLEGSFISDAEIMEAISRVRELEKNGVDPTVELGTPAAFAESFTPSPRKKRNYHWIMNAGGLLAVVWLIGIIVAAKVYHVRVPAHFFIPGTILAILAVSVVLSICVTWIRARRFS